MALDIYCGPLSRYYNGQWENIIEIWAEEQGVDYHINRKRPENDGEELSEEALKETILSWRENLKQFLHTRQQLDCQWQEGDETPYCSDRPDWSAYWLLILWALYQEQGEAPFDQLPQGFQIEKDRIFERHTMPGYETSYPMLMSEAELFLPIDDAVTISGLDPLNQPITIASSVYLLKELEQLNSNCWQADEPTIKSWRAQYNRVKPALVDGALSISHEQEIDRFEEVAKYGFSVLYHLCQFAVANQVPMRLDW